MGHDALKETTGSANLALGSGAGRNLTNGVENVDIAHPGVAGESGAIRIGTVGDQTAAFMAGISGASSPQTLSRCSSAQTASSGRRPHPRMSQRRSRRPSGASSPS